MAATHVSCCLFNRHVAWGIPYYWWTLTREIQPLKRKFLSFLKKGSDDSSPSAAGSSHLSQKVTTGITRPLMYSIDLNWITKKSQNSTRYWQIHRRFLQVAKANGVILPPYKLWQLPRAPTAIYFRQSVRSNQQGRTLCGSEASDLHSGFTLFKPQAGFNISV